MKTESPVLVVAAHPDDEVLGCGGTIARLSGEGVAVHVAILGEGLTSRGDAGTASLRTLRQHARQAASMLGVRDVDFGGFPDNQFDSCDLLSIVKHVENLIERIRPATIFTHHASDMNIDHSLTHRSVLTATRPLPGNPIPRVYAFEVPSSTEWSFCRGGGTFAPNSFVEIDGFLQVKLRAMECYLTETREAPHPRSAQVLEAISRRWGSVCGVTYAEAFELVRELRLLKSRSE